MIFQEAISGSGTMLYRSNRIITKLQALEQYDYGLNYGRLVPVVIIPKSSLSF